MLVQIENLLSADQIKDIASQLSSAEWGDGRATAGHLSSRVKNNTQLPENHPLARKLGVAIIDVLDQNQRFLSAALPLKMVPPMFNRYVVGQAYGSHVDSAMRPVSNMTLRVRTDLSATLFLSAPEDYDGGELVIEDSFGERRVKLPAGHLVLYPGTSVHSVTPVTRGERIASFFWIQSMVRDDAKRALLYELDRVVQALTHNMGPDAHNEVVCLAGIYHNLLRFWGDS